MRLHSRDSASSSCVRALQTLPARRWPTCCALAVDTRWLWRSQLPTGGCRFAHVLRIPLQQRPAPCARHRGSAGQDWRARHHPVGEPPLSRTMACLRDVQPSPRTRAMQCTNMGMAHALRTAGASLCLCVGHVGVMLAPSFILRRLVGSLAGAAGGVILLLPRRTSAAGRMPLWSYSPAGRRDRSARACLQHALRLGASNTLVLPSPRARHTQLDGVGILIEGGNEGGEGWAPGGVHRPAVPDERVHGLGTSRWPRHTVSTLDLTAGE